MSKEDRHMEVATIIMKQMGARKLQMFVKGREFIAIKGDHDLGGLRFKFSGNRKMNFCEVHLNGKDLYDVKLIKVHGTSRKVKAETNDVYAEDLRRVFEEHTGLYLSF